LLTGWYSFNRKGNEAGANLAMGRWHAWVLRGEEYVEPESMNRGDHLTLIGAIRLEGMVALATQWQAVNTETFTAWVRERLTPRLRHGDVVLLDNLSTHKAAAMRRSVSWRDMSARACSRNTHISGCRRGERPLRALRKRRIASNREILRASPHKISHSRQILRSER
jgi:DDE superfamily endonuclease